MIEDKYFYFSDGDIQYTVIAKNFEEAYSILKEWRPNFKIKSLSSSNDTVLTKHNIKEK